MKSLLIVLVLALLCSISSLPLRASSSSRSQVASLRHQIARVRAATWHYQDLRAPGHRTPTRYKERRTSSVRFLRWDKRLWTRRLHQARKSLRSHVLPLTADWVTAVRIVQRDWPNTSAWLLSCSAGEGGWGPFVMNYQGSGAGGWMQYLESTFAAHLGSALSLARARHLALPPVSARSWYSPLGQAFAAGWARLNIDTHGPWDPRKDPACA